MALFQSPLCSTLAESDTLGELRLQEFIQQRGQQSEINTGRNSSTCTQVVWIFFWLIVLIVFAYPIALVAAIFYVLLNPFALINCCHPSTRILLKLVNLPLTCARNMAEAKQLIIM